MRIYLGSRTSYCYLFQELFCPHTLSRVKLVQSIWFCIYLVRHSSFWNFPCMVFLYFKFGLGITAKLYIYPQLLGAWTPPPPFRLIIKLKIDKPFSLCILFLVYVISSPKWPLFILTACF